MWRWFTVRLATEEKQESELVSDVITSSNGDDVIRLLYANLDQGTLLKVGVSKVPCLFFYL